MHGNLGIVEDVKILLIGGIGNVCDVHALQLVGLMGKL